MTEKLRRDWIAGSILFAGEMALILYILAKFHVPVLVQFVLALLILAIPVMWKQTHNQFRVLAQDPQTSQMDRSLFIAGIVRPCAILSIMLFAIAWVMSQR